MARLTLADLEIERNAEAFEYETESGNVYTFSDPKGVPAKQLIVLEKLNPEAQLRAVLGAKADELLDEPEVDGYMLEAVLNAYNKHYGLDTAPNVRSSPRSSSGSASRSRRTSGRTTPRTR